MSDHSSFLPAHSAFMGGADEMERAIQSSLIETGDPRVTKQYISARYNISLQLAWSAINNFRRSRCMYGRL